MSIIKFFSDSHGYRYFKREPDPYTYTILKEIEINGNSILKVRYPQCKTYKGMKILIFKGLRDKTKFAIDPHFIEGNGIYARVVPTKDGWDLAIQIAKSI